MYVCMYVRTYVRTYVCIYIYIYIYICIHGAAQDVRDLVELTVDRMDVYHLVVGTCFIILLV